MADDVAHHLPPGLEHQATRMALLEYIISKRVENLEYLQRVFEANDAEGVLWMGVVTLTGQVLNEHFADWTKARLTQWLCLGFSLAGLLSQPNGVGFVGAVERTLDEWEYHHSSGMERILKGLNKPTRAREGGNANEGGGSANSNNNNNTTNTPAAAAERSAAGGGADTPHSGLVHAMSHSSLSAMGAGRAAGGAHTHGDPNAPPMSPSEGALASPLTLPHEAGSGGGPAASNSASTRGGGGGSSGNNHPSSGGGRTSAYQHLTVPQTPLDLSVKELVISLCRCLQFVYRKFLDPDSVEAEDCLTRIIQVDKRLEQQVFGLLSRELETLSLNTVNASQRHLVGLFDAFTADAKDSAALYNPAPGESFPSPDDALAEMSDDEFDAAARAAQRPVDAAGGALII